MNDIVRAAQERCSGDASYRAHVVSDGSMELHNKPRTTSIVHYMRRTPYTDSEGRDIYEGDIVQWEDEHGYIYVGAEGECEVQYLGGASEQRLREPRAAHGGFGRVTYAHKMAAIVGRIRDGDESAYDDYMALRGRKIREFCRRYLSCNHQSEEDARQEVLLRLWRHAHRMDLSRPAMATSYCERLERSCVVDTMRRDRYRSLRFGDDVYVIDIRQGWRRSYTEAMIRDEVQGKVAPSKSLDALDWEHLRDSVQDAVSQWGSGSRSRAFGAEAWRSHYLEGKEHKQFAAETGKKLEVVKIGVYRANQYVRAQLGEQWEALTCQ